MFSCMVSTMKEKNIVKEFLGDVIQANLLAANYSKKLKGEVFNIGNGCNVSINQVADMFGGKKTYGEKRLEPYETLADNKKARHMLKWEPKGNLATWIKNYKIDLGISLEFGIVEYGFCLINGHNPLDNNISTNFSLS